MDLYYLKPTIKAEPLIWQWYAWPYLIPPMTAACNIVERHLKIMQSYVQNPQIHCRAVQDPKLLGGPFIDLNGEKIDEIKELIIQTKQNCKELIELHDAFKELDKFLQTEGQGDSLEIYYNRIPKSLKGMVELVYDLNNHPSIRLIEPLIYRKYYSTQNQSIALSETKSDFRKFVLSTPKIQHRDEVHLQIPFSDPSLDTLFKMKLEPKKIEEIESLFSIEKSEYDLFKSFFTTKPPLLNANRKYTGSGIRLRYFGHACILLETKNISILMDPVISYPIETDEAREIPRYTLNDLPDNIDYVLFTHNHQDHILFETLLQIRHKIKNIIFPTSQVGALQDPSIKLILKHIGFKCNLIELKEMDSESFMDGIITGIPFFGEHSDLNIQSKIAYSIKLQDKQFLFAADSNNLEPELYSNIFNNIGAVDMLFLGMECDGAPLTWLYGPLLTKPLKRSYDNNRTLSGSNFDKAWEIVEKLKCKEAYVYAMGQEPWLGYIMALEYTSESLQMIESNKFIKICKEKDIKTDKLFGKKEWILE